MSENYTVSRLPNAKQAVPDRQAASEVKAEEPKAPIGDPLDNEYAQITIENPEDTLSRVVRLERVHPYLCRECGFNGLEPASKEFGKLFTADNCHELKPGQKAWLERGMALHERDAHTEWKKRNIRVEIKKARDLNPEWCFAENPNPTSAEPRLFPRVWTN